MLLISKIKININITKIQLNLVILVGIKNIIKEINKIFIINKRIV